MQQQNHPRGRIRPLLAVGLLLIAGCGGGSGLLPELPFGPTNERHLPASGAVPGLLRATKVTSYKQERMEDYFGPTFRLYLNYGAQGLSTADYTYLGEEKTLTIESFTMENATAAAGLYHYFRGRKLRGRGFPVEVGAEGVLDRERDGRNLYFYKNRIFAKVIYSGPEPVPGLVPIGRAMAADIPGSRERPRGFAFLDVAGVDPTSTYVSPGYTFNADFLPPGIFAKAPGAGGIAEVFLIGHFDRREAQQTAEDYMVYLRRAGTDFSRKIVDRRRVVWQARDPDQGRVICTLARSYVVGVVRPRTYAEGEAILDRIADRIESSR